MRERVIQWVCHIGAIFWEPMVKSASVVSEIFFANDGLENAGIPYDAKVEFDRVMEA